MVVGNRGLGAFRRRLPGSVSAAVIENARCPVGIVRSAPVTDAGWMGEPVLVGVGGTRRCLPAVAGIRRSLAPRGGVDRSARVERYAREPGSVRA
ncbi:universal stress protein [Nocardia beijingensis]